MAKSRKKARIQKKQAKARGEEIKKMTSRQKELYNQNLKLVNEVNRRIKALQKQGFEKTWASGKLDTRLDTKVLKSIDKKGKVKIRKDLSATQMLAVNKALNLFLESQTSTAKGIKKREENIIKGIRRSLTTGKKEVSSEDARFYYKMFEDSDFNFLTSGDSVKPSDLWALIDDSIVANDSIDSWLEKVSSFTNSEDQDVRQSAINIYNKYIG